MRMNLKKYLCGCLQTSRSLYKKIIKCVRSRDDFFCTFYIKSSTKFKDKKESLKLRWNKNSSFQKTLDIVRNKYLSKPFPELIIFSPTEIFHNFLSMDYYLVHLSK